MVENLPPTPTRIRLAKDIKAGGVKRFHWFEPWTCRGYDDRNVTDWVKRLVDAGLATYGDLGVVSEHYSIVSLTPVGEEWLNTYGSTE